jgi:hypothetical protein
MFHVQGAGRLAKGGLIHISRFEPRRLTNARSGNLPGRGRESLIRQAKPS